MDNEKISVNIDGNNVIISMCIFTNFSSFRLRNAFFLVTTIRKKCCFVNIPDTSIAMPVSIIIIILDFFTKSPLYVKYIITNI